MTCDIQPPAASQAHPLRLVRSAFAQAYGRRGSERDESIGLTLLVDGPSLVYRALFSTPDTIRTPAGAPINAAYGFLGMLAGLVAGQRPDELACADDRDWRPAWRVELVESYKLHRTLPGSPA